MKRAVNTLSFKPSPKCLHEKIKICFDSSVTSVNDRSQISNSSSCDFFTPSLYICFSALCCVSFKMLYFKNIFFSLKIFFKMLNGPASGLIHTTYTTTVPPLYIAVLLSRPQYITDFLNIFILFNLLLTLLASWCRLLVI